MAKTTPKQNGHAPPGSVNMFLAMSLSEIQPELIAYGPNGAMVTIDYEASTKTMIAKLKEAQLLEFPRIVFCSKIF